MQIPDSQKLVEIGQSYSGSLRQLKKRALFVPHRKMEMLGFFVRSQSWWLDTVKQNFYERIVLVSTDLPYTMLSVKVNLQRDS